SLPMGISFFTFQILSYIIDLYRGKYEVQRNPVSLALYISFFPQLIAGPIVQYESIRKQLDARTESLEKKAAGIRRFIYGLAKKVLIANTMARFVDTVYSTDSSFNGMISWLTAVAYMLQIYYDFSGYSDMAIGLGKMFGFEFSENFNYPYMSSSIHEFWQRWHISLGSWFREYLYFPLGGNRKGTVRTYYNLIIVFLLTGLWHGANMTFVLWGLFHVCFQIVERAGLTDILKRHRISAHIYTLLVVLFGWVLFRADTVSQALEIMKQMLLPWRYTYTSLLLPRVITHKFIVMMILGIAGMGFIQRPVRKISSTVLVNVVEYIYCMCILLLSMASLAGNTYNPFIYFRF
ncbi:MAG: MBOAT family protein, partial [Lachnospiraceae bacterium]|nr:MBOAT family protein [Lachnospiraceae bacterium]